MLLAYKNNKRTEMYEQSAKLTPEQYTPQKVSLLRTLVNNTRRNTNKKISAPTYTHQGETNDYDPNQLQLQHKQNHSETNGPKTKAKRQYNDVSKLKDLEVIETASKSVHYANARGRAQESFPMKLYNIIEWCSNESNYNENGEYCDYSSIISWLPHGRAFQIHNQKLFISKIIPIFFYQTKYTSFTRQLG